MSEAYEQMLAALRDGSGYVHLNVPPPRDAPDRQCVAYLWTRGEETRAMRAPTSSVAVTAAQARELLAAGAEWTAPSHLRAELVPGA